MQTGTHPGPSTSSGPPLRGGVQDLSPLGRGAAQAAGWVVPFVRCRRAAATALTAAVMTLMSVAGIALTSDHTHLVYQRDILKAATDAATLATTRHLWTLGQNLSDEDVKAALMPIARRYILANIPESRRERATETLTVTLVPDRTAGTVDITAEADLGGIIFGSWMYGNMVPSTRVGSLSELEVADGTTTTTTPTPDTPSTPSTPPTPITEVALAIDSTSSMGETVAGEDSGWACKEKLRQAGMPCDAHWEVCMERAEDAGIPCDESRMTIVKRAATELVNTITADTSRTVAVGLVPWHYRVQFDQATRTRWEDNGWAQYPTRRYYPYAYTGSYRQIPRSSNRGWFPDPYLVTNAGESHDLPAKGNQVWQGCVDQRRMSGDNPPGISAASPKVTPFTMAFYSPTTTYPRDHAISFACHDNQWGCFDPDGVTGSRKSAQFNCRDMPTIMPLTTGVEKIQQKISGLGEGGPATYSTLGVVWGHRLLAPAWRTIWNDAVHPVNAASHVRKVLVLLTDGDDNHLDQNIVRKHRSDACTAAKDAGIEIITVFAGDPSRDLKDELEKCASPVGEDANADDTNSFTGTTQAELEGAFETIGQRLRPLRLVR